MKPKIVLTIGISFQYSHRSLLKVKSPIWRPNVTRRVMRENFLRRWGY